MKNENGNIKSYGDLADLFYQEKPVKLMLALLNDEEDEEKSYASNLAKDSDCTYSHTVKILIVFEKKGLVQFSKSGRVKHVTLTSKGQALAKQFAGDMLLMSSIESGVIA